MITFICLFFPALIALGLYDKLVKTNLSVRNIVYTYAVFNLCINMVCFLLKKYVFMTGEALLCVNGVDMTPNIAVNYLIIAIPLALCLGVIAAFLYKNTDLFIEEDTHEEN